MRPAAGIVLALALCPLFLSLQASAAPKTKVLLLPVQSEALSAGERDAVTTVVRDALGKYTSLELLPTPKVDLLEVMLELECTDIDTECLGKIGKKYGGDQLVYLDAAAAGSKLGVKIKVIEVKSGKVLKETAETADAKSDLPGAVGKLAVAAFGPLPKVVEPVKPKMSDVSVTANVEGAEVFFNGTLTGKTPVKTQLKPGHYTVRVAKGGFVEVTQGVDVLPGKPFDVTFTLKEAVQDKVPPPVVSAPFYKQWWFWTAIGVGVAGIVTTAVVLSGGEETAPTGVVNFGISTPDQDPLVMGVPR